MSTLTRNQTKTFKKVLPNKDRIIAKVRFDDQCGNGHNTLSLTGLLIAPGEYTYEAHTCGCLHEEIAEAFPELAPLIPYHLCSTDGPLHYVPNTLYFASDKDWKNEPKLRELDAARRSAIWPDATDKELSQPPEKLKAALLARLPALLADFRQKVESLGFEW